VAGLTISQATGIVAVLLALGLYVWLRRLPLRSPRAVPYVPPADKAAKTKTSS